jgi:hypothetical protein
MVTREQLIEEYADWFSEYSWNWFGTVTFPGYPSRTIAIRKFDEWIAEIKRRDGTKSFRYVRVLERGAYEDNIHFHFLIGGLERRANWYQWRCRWQETNGAAVISNYDPKRGGIRYLLKSLLPDRDLDITIRLPQKAMRAR